MARIRTVKPEMFESESLAECSVTAMLTFIGLLTQADDSGRHRDHPAIIAGRLWALRPEHSATHVARDLEELDAAGLVCRYTGCDGRTWLHIVTWDQHQKINHPSESRVPRCPSHQKEQPCGKCKSASCPGSASKSVSATSVTSTGTLREDSGSPHGGFPGRFSPDATRAVAATPSGGSLSAPSEAHPAASAASSSEIAGQTDIRVDSRKAPGGLREGSPSGSRILDPGSVPTGREAPAPDSASGSVSAKELVAEYVSGCAHRPPEDFLGHLGRKIKSLLSEGFTPADLRAALERLRTKGLHPSVLPSLVNEVLNASPQSASSPPSASGGGPWASSGSAYTPYLNPAAESPTTFGGRL